VGLERHRDFGSRRDQDHVGRRSAGVRQDVRALRESGGWSEGLAVDHRELLASEHDTDGAGGVRQAAGGEDALCAAGVVMAPMKPIFPICPSICPSLITMHDEHAG
jgi:hypothetical protein